MRTETIEKKYYEYSELSDAAKENAREKYGQFLWEDGEMQERCQESADYILEQAGFEPAEDLSFSLYCQGGEPKFSTRSEEPIFLTPAVKGTRRKRYTVLVTATRWGMSVTAVATDGYHVPEEAQEPAKDLVLSLQHDISKAFYADDEYMSSDEAVRESSEANGYEYDEAGNLA